MTAKKKQNENSFANFIGAFFLLSSLVFGGYILFEDNLNLHRNEGGQADLSSLAKPSEMDVINDHMRSVSDKMEIDRMRTLVENLKAERNSGVGSNNQKTVKDDQPFVDFSNDPRERQLAQDLGRTNDRIAETQDPRTLAYNAVIESRRQARQEEFNRKEQAKEFVARARKDGWIVELDKNYKIKSYRPVDDNGSGLDDTDYRGYQVIPK